MPIELSSFLVLFVYIYIYIYIERKKERKKRELRHPVCMLQCTEDDDIIVHIANYFIIEK